MSVMALRLEIAREEALLAEIAAAQLHEMTDTFYAGPDRARA